MRLEFSAAFACIIQGDPLRGLRYHSIVLPLPDDYSTILQNCLACTIGVLVTVRLFGLSLEISLDAAC